MKCNKIFTVTITVILIFVSFSSLNVMAFEWDESDLDRWNPPDHKNIVYIACSKEDILKYRKTISKASEMPDIFDKNWIGVGGNEPNYFNSKQWLHGWFVDLGEGGAPGRCEEWVDQAISSYDSDDLEDAWTYIGYATHYLVDMAQPMHTDADMIDQAQYHVWYENYVTENWDSKFELALESYDGKEKVTNPQDACEAVAKISNSYLDELWTACDKKDYATIDNITVSCLELALAYTRGLLDLGEDYEPEYSIFDDFNLVLILIGILILAIVIVWVLSVYYHKPRGRSKWSLQK